MKVSSSMAWEDNKGGSIGEDELAGEAIFGDGGREGEEKSKS